MEINLSTGGEIISTVGSQTTPSNQNNLRKK